MARARTNNLHRKVPLELRRQVERDLIEQPPGRSTYREVWEHHRLADYGVGIDTVEDYGKYLREFAQVRAFSEFADAIVGQDLDAHIAGVIRTRLFEAVRVPGTAMGDLLKASIAHKTTLDAEGKGLENEIRASQLAAVLAKGEKDSEADPHKALADMTTRIREIYGL